MIDTSPMPVGVQPEARAPNQYRLVTGVQGAYYFLTGIWPLFGIDSFQAMTGPKFDLWLVYTVGSLVAVIGATLVWAAARGRITAETAVLAVGSAVALGLIDVIFVARGVISWVYLLDAAAQTALVGWWVLAHTGTPRWRPATPQYPHIRALLNRGASVTPTAPVSR
ncbi:MAG TPA: hypothetical protein VKE40_20730 [Gemmataceae bacterium]|nr:hypothetical protein [Gemmataceae bacterium]